MHCVVSNHGINQMQKWVSVGSLNQSLLKDTFRQHMVKKLEKNVRSKDRIVAREILRKINDKDWKIHLSIHNTSPYRIIDYLSRSVAGVVTDLEGIDLNKEKNQVTIRERHLGEWRETQMSRQTFQRRYLNHIPPKGAVMVRNYGIYSTGQAGKLDELWQKYLLEEEKENQEHRCSEKSETCLEECPVCDNALVLETCLSC